MLFSVVIPTHNRLDLLRGAVETVRRQRNPNWELVVFDNASTENIAAYVRSLNDSRFVYRRSDFFLPVTESWNSAIDLAKGDYVSFLGDDDGLTPDYFSQIGSIIDRFDSPEVIYNAIYQYFHPGVAPWQPTGYVLELKNGFFFVGQDQPFRMSTAQATTAVQGSISLRRNFTFNIQAFVFSRCFLERLRVDGPVFHSPFPDYYLANVAFAKSQSTVVVPKPLSIAGVSKSSFGFTLFNGLEDQGAALLNTKLANDPVYPSVERHLLPGPLYNTNYVVTMEHVVRKLGSLARCRVDYRRYRRLQIMMLLITSGADWRSTPKGQELWQRLTASEKVWARWISSRLVASDKRGRRDDFAQQLQKRHGPYAFEPLTRTFNVGRFSQLIEVFEAMAAEEFLTSGRPSMVAA